MACFCTLASGSSGNSTYIGSGVGGVLIDAGISCRGILAALEMREIDRESIGAVFITHEHTDHIKGLKVLLKKLPVPVYATDEVLDFLADRDYFPAGAKAQNTKIRRGGMPILPGHPQSQIQAKAADAGEGIALGLGQRKNIL